MSIEKTARHNQSIQSSLSSSSPRQYWRDFCGKSSGQPLKKKHLKSSVDAFRSTFSQDTSRNYKPRITRTKLPSLNAFGALTPTSQVRQTSYNAHKDFEVLSQNDTNSKQRSISRGKDLNRSITAQPKAIRVVKMKTDFSSIKKPPTSSQQNVPLLRSNNTSFDGESSLMPGLTPR